MTCGYYRRTILVINQINEKNYCFVISLLYATTCFEHYVIITRRSKLYYTASGIIIPVGGRPVHRLREDSFNLCTVGGRSVQVERVLS